VLGHPALHLGRLVPLGAVSVLAKPFRFDTLADTLRGLLKVGGA
jgi:hypothetical protein